METASMTSTAAPLIVARNNVCGDGIVQSVFEFVMTAIPTRAAIVMLIAAVLEPAILWGLTSPNSGDGTICEQFKQHDGNTDNDDAHAAACGLRDGFLRKDLSEGEPSESCDDGDLEDSGNGVMPPAFGTIRAVTT